jgi:predicted membrane-bound spermidine synthase
MKSPGRCSLPLLLFTTGFVTLGMELSAARLLEPAFGTNQIVWAALIGLILLYLAVGAWLGGWLADRFPRRAALDVTLTLAAVGVALIPALSRPVLRWAAFGLDDFALELLLGSLFAILLLFSAPGILLGTASPWAVRLSLIETEHAGSVAGRLYAVGTAGSLVGAFLPVLVLIPAVGTRWTFFLLALTLLAVLTLTSIRRPRRWIPLTGLIIVALLAWWSQADASIRLAWDDGRKGEIIYEDESLYNYIAVRQWGSERHLKLNDGVGIHSVAHPDELLSNGIWDYFLLAPLWREGRQDESPVDNLLIIGLAAGTVSELFTNIFGPIPITGVELDPQIIEVGERFFGMNQPNLTAVAADGRAWLSQQPADAQWDMIAVDAYRPPYIPFHLTTLEFFELARAHLNHNGVLAINVGRTTDNYALVDALAATVGAVFPSVFLIDEPGPPDQLGNTLLVATMQPKDLDSFRQSVAALPSSLPDEFHNFVAQAAPLARVAQLPLDATIFTDDHAPVERIVHQIIVSYLRGE